MNKETAQRLLTYMQEKHGVTLPETELQEIERILSPSPMEGKTPLKGWVNVYKRLDNEFNEELYPGAVYDTILDSKLNRHENCIACIDLSKHYEGEGL